MNNFRASTMLFVMRSVHNSCIICVNGAPVEGSWLVCVVGTTVGRGGKVVVVVVVVDEEVVVRAEESVACPKTPRISVTPMAAEVLLMRNKINHPANFELVEA